MKDVLNKNYKFWDLELATPNYRDKDRPSKIKISGITLDQAIESWANSKKPCFNPGWDMTWFKEEGNGLQIVVIISKDPTGSGTLENYDRVTDIWSILGEA